MRRQNIFFILLLLSGGLIAGYFSLKSASSCFDFFTFKQSAPARILKWEINEVKGKFPIQASYVFEFGGKMWHGKARLSKPWHLNEAAARAFLQKIAKREWVVWFNPDHPQKSGLEKLFPTGLLVRTFICYAVLVYFTFLFIRFSN
ncbi:MAG TPA: hypothetical protein VLE95_02695 [Chlamydiales bacterium]|nr:hypothetical protein [Chlamydiales bacterium]